MSIPKESVGMRQRKPRLEQFIVTGTGTAAIGEGIGRATLTDNGGQGDYTITLVEPGQRPCVVVGLVCQTATCYAELSGAPTASAIRVLTKATSTNTLTDAIFHLTVMVYDSPEQYQ